MKQHSRRRFKIGTVAQWSLISIISVTPLAIQAGQPPNQGTINSNVTFSEVRGDHEFSGRLIVRPIQHQTLQKQGWTVQQIRNHDTLIQLAMGKFVVDEYVPQTDEYIIEVPANETESQTARRLLATGHFQYAEPDWILFPLSCPNDSKFNSQWQHTNMQSCAGWNIHTGNPTASVGICDTGIRTTHEDFQLHRMEGYNAVDRVWESQGGQIGPVHPHGTMTSGCAAANGNNGKGVSGMGWDLSFRMLRVSNSSGGSSSLSTLQHAARTAVENGNNVASVSYSGADTSSNLTTATYIKSIGGLLVWAAGNDGRNLTFGNRDNDDLIVVGATDINDNSASFSAYGQFVDVVAPGVNIFTTDSGFDSDYATTSGTSFSTPMTAGLIALIWSADSTLTPDEVESILKQGADDLGSNGVDNTFGYGRINVNGSLGLLGGGTNQPPVANLSATPLSGTAPLDVSFDASASFDSDGTIVNYEWDWEGDGIYDASTGTNPFSSHTYSTANVYNATVRVTDDQNATDTDFVTITVNSGGGNQQSIAFDGFESKSFTGGTGAWVGGWFGGGDVRIRWKKDGPHTGNGHVRERRNTGDMERIVDLAGATNVHLQFWSKVKSFEGSDQAVVWVSSDGFNFTPVAVFTAADSDNIYHGWDVDLSGFAMTSNFRIVFESEMSSRKDYWYLDDIEIIGVP